MTLPPITDLKAQAKRLRSALPDGAPNPLSHGQALDVVARQHGYRDWNTLFAAKGNRPDFRFSLGDQVEGTYLRQPFTGTIISAAQAGGGRLRLTLEFDTPVDVVTFDSFSAFRHRVSVTVDETGTTAEKTSDGVPHMRLRPRAV